MEGNIMNREEFDKLSIEEQIKYINAELQNGSTLTKTCTRVGIDRSTIRKRFKKAGYEYNVNSNLYDRSVTNVSNTSLNKIEDKGKTIVPSSKELIDKPVMESLLELHKSRNKLMEIINWFEGYKSKTNVTNEIKINLPKEVNKNFRKTIRVNDNVWAKFSDFCKEHREFKEKDLLSQALLEYIKKHK